MFDIDLVYLYVNGNDPEWIAKRNAYIGKPLDIQENCDGRYSDKDELKYSLRSIEKYAPWIHKIFIVTDNQIPKWLDTSNPKIQIVDHTEIMPEECLPCFNSVVIEHHLHNIPGLSEHFLYANDDMYINQPVTPEFFFAEDSLPIVRLNRRFLRKFTLYYRENILRKNLGVYLKTIQNAAALVENKYGIYYSGKTHHNIDAYLKSTYSHTRQVFEPAGINTKSPLETGTYLRQSASVPLLRAASSSARVYSLLSPQTSVAPGTASSMYQHSVFP